MAEVQELSHYYQLAEQLIEKCSKEEIARCARILALNVAHYQSKYGELPLDETLAMIGMDNPTPKQLQLAADGMEVLVGVLGSLVTGLGEPKH